MHTIIYSNLSATVNSNSFSFFFPLRIIFFLFLVFFQQGNQDGPHSVAARFGAKYFSRKVTQNGMQTLASYYGSYI